MPYRKMNLTELQDQIVLYIDFLIEFVENDDSVETLGKRCHEISRHYRALGICGLLVNGDIDEFFHSLIRSAQTRKYFLDRCLRENYMTDPYMAASFIGPFFDAVAAHQFHLAEAIARLSPITWQERDEYEDDFAYTNFLHILIMGGLDALQQSQPILDQFEAALEGVASPRLEVCKSLRGLDQEQFAASFDILLNARKAEVQADRKTSTSEEITFEPEASIFVEGLALLKIAERLGLPTDPEYSLCPALARRTDYRPFEPDGFPHISLE